MDEVELDHATIHFLPVIRGLRSESATVQQAIQSVRPIAIGLSIGPEELESLRSYQGGPLPPENFEEEVYVAGLSAWEPPVKPPPCFSDAIKQADAQRVPVEGVDMDEATYTESYVDCVSALEVVFVGRMEKRLTKKRFRAQSPREHRPRHWTSFWSSVDDGTDEGDDLRIPHAPRVRVHTVDVIQRIVRGAPSTEDMSVRHAVRPHHPRAQDVHEDGLGPELVGP